ncbi:MAG: hypothetical protein KJ626_01155 [Verrucomicrobia bacterium]|nr:hypothetical protein [Verrucomicrobiota bacterium]
MLLTSAAFVPLAWSAIFFTETWDADNAGWVDRDTLEMLVAYNAFDGGTLAGTFSLQTIGVPEVDAFRATSDSSSGSFFGDYYAGLGAVYGLQFDFFAENNLPSAALVRFSDGTFTFFRSFLSQIGSVGEWNDIYVPLESSAGWFGGSSTAFTNALGNVQWVEVQLARNNIGSQTYYLDNFAHADSLPAGGEATGVPEPGTLGISLVGLLILRGLTRRNA